MSSSSNCPEKPAIIVVFGVCGDLVTRKIIPAFAKMLNGGRLHPETKIIGIARKPISTAEFRSFCFANIGKKISQDQSFIKNFHNLFEYCQLDFLDNTSYKNLDKLIQKINVQNDSKHIVIHYLSTHSDFFVPICSNLQKNDLLSQSRVVLEKPLGFDENSAQDISKAMSSLLQEQQIFRIDHYLGKEAVQNVLALRLGNSFMESLWNRQHISHIEITAAEKVGVGSRGGFYDKTGVMRDMVQSHLLQLLSIIAMEPPINRHYDSVRDEKVKVLKSLRTMEFNTVLTDSIRGQYQREGETLGYREETNVANDSNTETFVALKCWVDNWRWSNIPFYIRTGKRMPKRLTQIVIYFRSVPITIFPIAKGHEQTQALIIGLNPKNTVSLQLMVKTPGNQQVLRPVKLSLDFNEHFGLKSQSAYERLIGDIIQNDLTLFLRHDEVILAWQWVDKIIQSWQKIPDQIEFYDSHSWGPSNDYDFIRRGGYQWAKTLTKTHD